ncbi:MAG: ThuA domain-containing protein, partial [Myxococcota bacterium]
KMLFIDQDLRMGEDHPVIWWRCVGRGRAIYSALGHGPEVYETPEVQGLLEGAISWAARLEGEGCS